MNSVFNHSPALRKLFHNRLAVVAMSVIAIYLVVFVWILAMEAAAAVGNWTGAYDLGEHPVLGALLPGATLDRVGPANLPGFGLAAPPEVRTEQALFHIQRVGDALAVLENKLPGDQRTDEQILDQLTLAERRVAPIGVPALRELHAGAKAQFDSQTDLRILRSNLLKTRLAVRTLRGYSKQYRENQDPDKAQDLLEEVSLSLEEIGYQLEDLLPRVPPESPLGALDPEVFFSGAQRVLEEPTPDPLTDPALLKAVNAAVAERLTDIDSDINDKLDELEPIIMRIFPRPTGIDGLLYDIRLLLGTDRQGRSIFIRAVYSAKVALQVGVIVSIFAVGFGSLIGAAAGYFGGWVDHAVIWLYSTLSSIPDLVLLVVLAFMFKGSELESTLVPLYVAFGLTYWIGPCRVTRGETLKLKQLDYVQAANALGAGRARILVQHIIPNTAHLVFINLSLLFIAAIKGEVVLTFLGLGLKDGASWGIMVDQSRAEVVSGFFWQIGAATFFMFVLVLAFNILTDALQDAFDPKHID